MSQARQWVGFAGMAGSWEPLAQRPSLPLTTPTHHHASYLQPPLPPLLSGMLIHESLTGNPVFPIGEQL